MYTKIKRKPEGKFLMHFGVNWLKLAALKEKNIQTICDEINLSRAVIYKLRDGSYTASISVYTLARLSHALGMEIIDVLNYAPYEAHVLQNRTKRD